MLLATGIKLDMRESRERRKHWLDLFMDLPNNLADPLSNFNKAYWSWQCLKMVADDNNGELMQANFNHAIVTYWDEFGEANVKYITLLKFMALDDKSMAARVSAGRNAHTVNTRIPNDIITPAIRNNAAVMEKLMELHLIDAQP